MRFPSSTAPHAVVPPRVTVVVPCYNYGLFLPACVDSLLGQQGVDVDVLIIDDKSPDGSAEVAESLADKHARVRCIQHEVNRGHISTYNEGLDQAEGAYVVLLDADDVIAPGALARAAALMEAHPSVGMVYGQPRTFTGPIPSSAGGELRSWSVWDGPAWVRAQCKRGLSIVYSPEVVMRNSVRRSVGGFRTELPHAADLDMWLRIAAVSDIGRVNGPDQAFRRIHAQSMMQTGYGTVLADLRGRLDAFESFFEHDAGTLADRVQLRNLCRRVTAKEALDWVCTNLESVQPPESAAIHEYIQFATAIYPHAVELPQWRQIRRLCRPARQRNFANRLVIRAVDARRVLHRRLTWRRWYYFGY